MAPDTSPLDFIDAGASDDEPVMAHRLGLTQGHLRSWADLIEKLCCTAQDIENAIHTEREACAKIADAARKDPRDKEPWLVAFDIANTIRMRNYAEAIGIL